MVRKRKQPICVVIAGPNGAGKTTFARRYLPEDVGAAKVGRALRRAARDARRTARMHGVPIYVWEKGKIVALKP